MLMESLLLCRKLKWTITEKEEVKVNVINGGKEMPCPRYCWKCTYIFLYCFLCGISYF